MSSTTDTKTEFDPAVNMAMQSLCRFASLTLLDPRAGAWQQLHLDETKQLVTQAADFVRQLPAAAVSPLARCERPLSDLDPAAILAALPDSPAQLNGTYQRTFGLLVSGACPPYETEYIDSTFSFQRSHALADVSGFYRAFGLKRTDLHPERPDHIVLELELLSCLLALERQAAESDDPMSPEQMAACCDAQRSFVRQHLGWWSPTFAVLMAKQAGDGFYFAAGLFLAALIPMLRGVLDIPTTALPEAVAPIAPPCQEECEKCRDS